MAKIYKIFYFFLLFLSPLLTAYLIGFDRIFYAVGDTDLALLGEGLAFNSNLSQSFFDHPSFPLYLIIGWWYKILYFLDLGKIYNFETLYLANNKIEAMQGLVVRLRILAVLINIAYLLVLYVFLKKLTNSQCAKIGLLIAATSQGVMSQSVMLRMEPASLIFMLLGLICLLKMISQERISAYSIFIWSSCVSIFFYLAAITKVTLILYGMLLVPFVFLIVMSRKKSLFVIKAKKDKFFIFLLMAVGLVYSYEVWQYFYRILYSEKSFVFYLLLISIYLGFSQYFFRSPKIFFIQLLSIVYGITFSYSLNFIRYSPKNQDIVLNFVDHSKRFSDGLNLSTADPILLWLDRLYVSVISKLDLTWIYDYPIQVFLYLGAFLIIRSHSNKSNYLFVFIFGYLFLSEIFVETLSRFRYILPRDVVYLRANYDTIVYYKIYNELFVILAFVIGYFVYCQAKITRVSKLSLFTLIFLISGLSMFLNISLLKNDMLYGLYFNQTAQNACNQTRPAKHLIYYLSGNNDAVGDYELKNCYKLLKEAK